MYKKLTKNLYSQKSVIKFYSRNVLFSVHVEKSGSIRNN